MNDNINNENNSAINGEEQQNSTVYTTQPHNVIDYVGTPSNVNMEQNNPSNMNNLNNLGQNNINYNINNQNNMEQNNTTVPSNNINNTGKKNNTGLYVVIILLAVAIIGGVTLGTKMLVDKKNSEKFSIEKPASKKNETSDSKKNKVTKGNKENDGATVADVVENVMPSIVSIACTVSQDYSFFGRSYTEDAEGSGSGIIIGQNEKQVYIATNNHVIEGANTVIITFNDDEEVKAEIKGTDSSNDLAVVSVNISDMKESTKEAIKVASLGESNDLKVGEMAVAIGNALGYGQSVTVGVISALNREISSEDYTMSLIQTDAAINPGNSGGALINSKGEVIGINSVKYVSEDTEGMGYAIPITDAIEILNSLMNYEEIPEEERAYLGIIGYDIDENFSKRSNTPEGIYIKEISKASPAAKSGLKVGDIIVKFDGKKVLTMEKIQNIMKNKKNGDKVQIVVMRANEGKYEEKTLTVKFGARGDYIK